MELCSCRDWAVNLDMSRVKAKNNEIGLFRRETTHEVFCFQKEGKKKTPQGCCALQEIFCFHLLTNMCNLPWQCIQAPLLYTLHSRKRHFLTNITQHIHGKYLHYTSVLMKRIITLTHNHLEYGNMQNIQNSKVFLSTLHCQLISWVSSSEFALYFC